jgi:hypothetical protein
MKLLDKVTNTQHENKRTNIPHTKKETRRWAREGAVI